MSFIFCFQKSSQNVQPSISNSSINRQQASTKSPSSSSIKETNSVNSSQSSVPLASNRVLQNTPSRPTSPEIIKQAQASQQPTERPKTANAPNNTRLGPNQNQKGPNLARSATLNENNSKNNNILKTAQKPSIGNSEDSEDTMNNLRKTFAGIFGNSNL